ncbi:hypothetical protein IWZ01DRAFT_545872 [Phyllosticta capitalensis]
MSAIIANTALMSLVVPRPRQSTTALTPRRDSRNADDAANAINLRNIRDGVDVRTTVMVRNIPNKMDTQKSIAFLLALPTELLVLIIENVTHADTVNRTRTLQSIFLVHRQVKNLAQERLFKAVMLLSKSSLRRDNIQQHYAAVAQGHVTENYTPRLVATLRHPPVALFKMTECIAIHQFRDAEEVYDHDWIGKVIKALLQAPVRLKRLHLDGNYELADVLEDQFHSPPTIPQRTTSQCTPNSNVSRTSGHRYGRAPPGPPPAFATPAVPPLHHHQRTEWVSVAAGPSKLRLTFRMRESAVRNLKLKEDKILRLKKDLDHERESYMERENELLQLHMWKSEAANFSGQQSMARALQKLYSRAQCVKLTDRSIAFKFDSLKDAERVVSHPNPAIARETLELLATSLEPNIKRRDPEHIETKSIFQQNYLSNP